MELGARNLRVVTVGAQNHDAEVPNGVGQHPQHEQTRRGHGAPLSAIGTTNGVRKNTVSTPRNRTNPRAWLTSGADRALSNRIPHVTVDGAGQGDTARRQE